MNILKTSTREEILAQLKHISKYIEQSKATNLSKWPASEQVEYLDQIIDQIENQIKNIDQDQAWFQSLPEKRRNFWDLRCFRPLGL